MVSLRSLLLLRRGEIWSYVSAALVLCLRSLSSVLAKKEAMTTAFESERLARSRTELRDPTHQYNCAHAYMRVRCDLDQVRSLCVS